jgi:hypothetical protein
MPRGRHITRKIYEDPLHGIISPSNHSVRTQQENLKKINNYHTFAIQVPSPKKFIRSIKNRKEIWIKIAVIFVSVAILYVSYQIFRATRASNDDTQTDSSYIAPEAVYTPRNLPEGYSVGSSSQTLENGAVLYQIYDNKGRSIIVTQQSKPNEFDEKILEGAAKFQTPSGTGYVLENIDRTTGYLFTEKSWVLLNSTDGVDAAQMREVIHSLKY